MYNVSWSQPLVQSVIGGRGSRKCEDIGVDYVIEVTEIDPDDKDMYQVLGQIEPINYSADIIRIEKKGKEGKERCWGSMERRLLPLKY